MQDVFPVRVNWNTTKWNYNASSNYVLKWKTWISLAYFVRIFLIKPICFLVILSRTFSAYELVRALYITLSLIWSICWWKRLASPHGLIPHLLNDLAIHNFLILSPLISLCNFSTNLIRVYIDIGIYPQVWTSKEYMDLTILYWYDHNICVGTIVSMGHS